MHFITACRKISFSLKVIQALLQPRSGNHDNEVSFQTAGASQFYLWRKGSIISIFRFVDEAKAQPKVKYSSKAK